MLVAILTFCGLVVLTSCSNGDEPVKPQEDVYTGVPLVILDTDLGSSTDDLFALEMLHRYEPSATGNCRYQLPGSADWNVRMLEKIRRYNRMEH